MYLQLITLLIFISFTAWANPSQKEIETLFEKYQQITQGHKIALGDVFTKEFIAGVGGEKSLREGWEKEKKTKQKLMITPARKDPNMIFVKRGTGHSSFIVVKKEGKWLIEGTIEDENN
ncbi:MAG: hypothetical protein ACK5XN_28500 [Bacteroidota bacterium]